MSIRGRLLLVSGDVVSGIGADNALLDFQPAAGVEVVIVSAFGEGSLAGQPTLFDGTNVSVLAALGNDAIVGIKLMLTNTLYLRLANRGATRFNSYSGMEL